MEEKTPPAPKKSLLFGIFITIIAYLFASISSAFVKMVPNHFPMYEVVFFQNLLCLIFSIFYCIKRKSLTLKTPYLKTHLIRDISGVLSYLFYFMAIQHIHIIDATTLAYTAPFFTPFLWKIWTKEKMEHDIWWTVILGFIGIVLILKPGKEIIQLGAVLGLAAGILSALALVAIRRLNQHYESLSLTLFYLFLVSVLVLLPFVILYWQTPTTWEWILLSSIGISTFISQIFLTIAFRYGTASFLSPLCYVMIIFVGFISWIFFQQPPDWFTAIGSMFIIVGGSLTYILRKRTTSVEGFFKREEVPIQKKWWYKWTKRK